MGTNNYALAKKLEKEMVFLMRLLEALARRRNYPLERAHYLLLLQVESDPKKINDLANILALDATTVTRQVTAMQKQGLVTKTSDKQDRRITWVTATEQGTVLANEMNAIRIQRLDEIFKEWPESDKKDFSKMLERFNQSLYKRLAEI